MLTNVISKHFDIAGTPRRAAVVAAMVLSLCLIAAEPASAAEGPGSDGVSPSEVQSVLATLASGVAADTLTDRDQYVLENYVLVEHVEIVDLTPLEAPATLRSAPQAAVVAASSSGCKTTRVLARFRAAAGNVLGTAFTEGTWCYSGGRITSKNFEWDGGETGTPGWSYEGRTLRRMDTKNNVARLQTRHKFVLKAGAVTLQTMNLCPTLLGRSNGTHTSSASCSYAW